MKSNNNFVLCNTSYYDDKGQPRLSQNAEQAAEILPTYSYTKYDAQSRLIEVGEMEIFAGGGPDPTTHPELLNRTDFSLDADYVKTDISRTRYDYAPDAPFPQENLRGRVTMTETSFPCNNTMPQDHTR